MSRPTLYIGNKRYSSWSLRAWLVLKQAGIEFDEVVVPLDTPDFASAMAALGSPVRQVPLVVADGLVIWDSLAVAEWAAERVPSLWPSDEARRAQARAHAATMHSGFKDLRREAPMNLGRERKPKRLSEAVRRDIACVEALWLGFGSPDSGPFLFGAWSIADAFWTPVATRIRSYGIPVGRGAEAYVDALLSQSHYLEWLAAAQAETYPNPLNDDI